MVCCHKNPWHWHWHWHLCSQCFGIFLANLEYEIFHIFLQDNRVTDHRLKMNFELTGFLMGDIESAVQSCSSMEQKELLEEMATSVGAAKV
jgi:hypothetical protein